jgi:hemerythrin-like domain-containing protein
LREEFLADHRKMTQGLSKLIDLLESGDVGGAVRKARQLDRVIGPHIEFEEKRFYPEVRKARGENYVRNLYDEHQSGVEAIRALEAIEEGSPQLDDASRQRILKQLRIALEHAFSCGTLLSHVTSLAKSEQDALLEELERFRSEAHLWTELEKPAHRKG